MRLRLKCTPSPTGAAEHPAVVCRAQPVRRMGGSFHPVEDGSLSGAVVACLTVAARGGWPCNFRGRLSGRVLRGTRAGQGSLPAGGGGNRSHCHHDVAPSHAFSSKKPDPQQRMRMSDILSGFHPRARGLKSAELVQALSRPVPHLLDNLYHPTLSFEPRARPGTLV